MLQEDSSEVSKDAADRLEPGTELKLLDNSQKYRTVAVGSSLHNKKLKITLDPQLQAN